MARRIGKLALPLYVSESIVRRTRVRFCEAGLDAALEAETAERRPLLNEQQEGYLVALACSDPPNGRERWTLELLTKRLIRALVDTFGKIEADRIAARLYFHHTPPHGSWLNIAEIELSLLARPCLRRRLPDEWTLALEVLAWENVRNQSPAKIHWRFSVEAARRVFRDHYPSFSSC